MYWDYAATTPIKPEVLEAMMPYFTDKWYNPSSIYEPAREVRRDVEEARAKIAKFINAYPDEIFFTSGGSESNSWVIENFDYRNDPVYTTEMEHHSIDYLLGGYVLNFYANKWGEITYDSMSHLSPSRHFGKELISIHLANNEIGTIQPIKEICELFGEDYFIHTDAVQAFGKIPIDVKDLGVHFLSASGHKIGTPKGIGILYIRKDVQKELGPIIFGSQESGKRGGTENVPYIIGLAKAVELVDFSKQKHFKEIYQYAIEQSKDWAVANGHPDHRLYNILSLTIKEPIDGQQLIGLLNDQGQYVSAGSACMAYDNKPSHVLKAIGLSDEEATRTIRISFPDNVTKNDIDVLFNSIKQNVRILKMLDGSLENFIDVQENS